MSVAKKGIHFLFQAEAEREFKTSIEIVLYYKYRAPHSTLIPDDQKTLKWSPDVKFWTTRENDILCNTTYIYIYMI